MTFTLCMRNINLLLNYVKREAQPKHTYIAQVGRQAHAI